MWELLAAFAEGYHESRQQEEAAELLVADLLAAQQAINNMTAKFKLFLTFLSGILTEEQMIEVERWFNEL